MLIKLWLIINNCADQAVIIINNIADQAVLTSIGRGRGLCPDLRQEISGKWGFWKLFLLQTCQHSIHLCFRISIKLLHPSQSLKFCSPRYTPAIQLINSLDKIDKTIQFSTIIYFQVCPRQAKIPGSDQPALPGEWFEQAQETGKQTKTKQRNSF